MITSLLACGLALLSANAIAQPLEGGARTSALAGSATALVGDVWGHANPASRAGAPQTSVSFFASQGYGLPELRLGAAVLTVPTRYGTLAAGAQTFGFEAFRQHVFLFGYARPFSLGPGWRLHLGIDVRYHRTAIPSYGHEGGWTVAFGWIAEVVPGLSAGFQAANLVTANVTGADLERSLAGGITYQPVKHVSFLLDVMKDVRFPLSVRSGLEYQPVSALALRAGMATQPVRLAFGAGVNFRHLIADAVAERHDVLGWTPGLSVTLSL